MNLNLLSISAKEALFGGFSSLGPTFFPAVLEHGVALSPVERDCLGGCAVVQGRCKDPVFLKKMENHLGLYSMVYEDSRYIAPFRNTADEWEALRREIDESLGKNSVADTYHCLVSVTWQEAEQLLGMELHGPVVYSPNGRIMVQSYTVFDILEKQDADKADRLLLALDCNSDGTPSTFSEFI